MIVMLWVKIATNCTSRLGNTLDHPLAGLALLIVRKADPAIEELFFRVHSSLIPANGLTQPAGIGTVSSKNKQLIRALLLV